MVLKVPWKKDAIFSDDSSSGAESTDEIIAENDEVTRVRRNTRLPKVHNDLDKSGGKKCKIIHYDEMGKFSGENAPMFSRFLGELVRRQVGLKYTKWKSVTHVVKDKL
uniref:Uncharacterized protein n=1 Tax=Lactuca sativa TaxID=4236 RepID=A0A9R1VP92_LACSA|nr:hypothetical protein LSAT_V11C400207870 [Lactuca sativa]